MLDFLLGLGETEKIAEIYRRAAADAKNGKSVFILVPEQYSLYAEQELLEVLGLSAQNRIQILTFSRLSNMIFSKLGPLRTKYIDKAGKYLMACRAMQSCLNDLGFFGRNIYQPGFASLLCSTISEFKRYGVTPEHLSETAEKTENVILAQKLRDFSVICHEFDRLIDEAFVNAEDNLALALLKIPQADFISGSVYISFFKSFTPVEYEVLKCLMQKCDVCVSLCLDNDKNPSPVFSVQAHTLSKLYQTASDAGVSVQKPVFMTAGDADIPHELKHLKDNYFAARPASFKGKPSCIHLIRPQNYFAEVQQAARLIKRLCRTKGYSLNDFLILTGSLEAYELILPSIFEEYNINLFLDQKIKLAESPLMRMITAVLEILAYGFSYERIMHILRSGFWNITKAEADIFENYILAADLAHKQWNSRTDWIYNPSPKIFDMERINEIRRKTVEPILDLMGLFHGRKTITTICDTLCQWFNSISLCDTVSLKLDEASVKNTDTEGLRQVWNSFVSVINQMSDCLGSSFATFTEFYELFTSCLGELSAGITPQAQDKVIVSEIDRFRSVGAKVVIVLGVLDKVFPKSHNSEGLLSDSERLALSDAGLVLAPDCISRQKEEQFLVYSVLTTARCELYLFSPISDRDGKALGGSEIFKRIRGSLFPDIAIEAEGSSLDSIEGKEHTFYELCANLFECEWKISRLSPLWKAVFDCFENDDAYTARLDAFKNMYNQNREPVRLSREMAKKLYGDPLYLSVSRLEKYNSCAFSFFMQYGLLAEERLLRGLKPNDTGTILHDVLCRYFKEKTEANADYSEISREECFSDISGMVNEFAHSSDNAMFTSSNFYGYMLMRIKNIASATAYKLVKFYSQSEFRPSMFEVGFGSGKELPPYKIQTKDGELTLSGFIDRVDSAVINNQEYITVTDYKSSEKRIDAARIDAGITIQPLIYANAVAKATNNAKPAAMIYLQMNDPLSKFDRCPTPEEWEISINNEIKAHGLFLDEADVISAFDKNPDDKKAVHYVNCDKKSRLVKELFEKKLADAESCAAQTAEKISDGEIDAAPPKIPGFDPCSYCPYESICNDEN